MRSCPWTWSGGESGPSVRALAGEPGRSSKKGTLWCSCGVSLILASLCNTKCIYPFLSFSLPPLTPFFLLIFFLQLYPISYSATCFPNGSFKDHLYQLAHFQKNNSLLVSTRQTAWVDNGGQLCLGTRGRVWCVYTQCLQGAEHQDMLRWERWWAIAVITAIALLMYTVEGMVGWEGSAIEVGNEPSRHDGKSASCVASPVPHNSTSSRHSIFYFSCIIFFSFRVLILQKILEIRPNTCATMRVTWLGPGNLALIIFIHVNTNWYRF